MVELNLEFLSSLLTVTQVAELHDVPARVVRKAAKATPCQIPGAIEVLGKWGFDPNKIGEWVPPEAGERTVAVAREDGRRRYRIYLSDEERNKLLAENFEIVDLREAGRARRAARKLAKAKAAAGECAGVAGETEAAPDVGAVADPFATFGKT